MLDAMRGCPAQKRAVSRSSMKLDTTRLHRLAGRLRVSSGRDVDLAHLNYSNRAIGPCLQFQIRDHLKLGGQTTAQSSVSSAR